KALCYTAREMALGFRNHAMINLINRSHSCRPRRRGRNNEGAPRGADFSRDDTSRLKSAPRGYYLRRRAFERIIRSSFDGRKNYAKNYCGAVNDCFDGLRGVRRCALSEKR